MDCPQNVVLISIASVKDPGMAPPGKHTLHAYVPATEPYELWKGLDRRRCGPPCPPPPGHPCTLTVQTATVVRAPRLSQAGVCHGGMGA